MSNRKISKLRAKAKKEVAIWSKARRAAYLSGQVKAEAEAFANVIRLCSFVSGLEMAEQAMEETK